jgi:hypothetical protein
MEKRKDLLTGEEFIPKKKTQKYSCPKNRIKSNNNKANYLRKEISNINTPLLNNYRIMKELMGAKKEEHFPKQFLLGKGFSFGVFTHYEFHENDNQTAFYSFIIIEKVNDIIQIIKTNNHD